MCTMSTVKLLMMLFRFATLSVARQTTTVHSIVANRTDNGASGFFLSPDARNRGLRTEEAQVAVGRAAATDAVEGLNYSCVFFAHVPKTGGTTMRAVLESFVKSRSQKLIVCYNSAACEWSSEFIHNGPWNGVYNDFKSDKCQKNQIVYGHGVDPDFPEKHNMATEGAAWIAMIREPKGWAVSRFEHAVRVDHYNNSFENWVKYGHNKDVIDREYLRYFAGPSKSTEPFGKRVRSWMTSENVLILFNEHYFESVHRLAHFLGASLDEESKMVTTAMHKLNVEPGKSYEMRLSEKTSEIFERDLVQAYQVYNEALRFKPESMAAQ